MVPQATCPPARQCWIRAWERATAERLVPFYLDGTRWAVKDYTVTVTCPGWSALSCNCAAGRQGRVCKHAAVTAKADQAKRIADDLNGGYGATEETAAAVHATLIAGVAPQLADMFA